MCERSNEREQKREGKTSMLFLFSIRSLSIRLFCLSHYPSVCVSAFFSTSPSFPLVFVCSVSILLHCVVFFFSLRVLDLSIVYGNQIRGNFDFSSSKARLILFARYCTIPIECFNNESFIRMVTMAADKRSSTQVFILSTQIWRIEKKKPPDTLSSEEKTRDIGIT